MASLPPTRPDDLDAPPPVHAASAHPDPGGSPVAPPASGAPLGAPPASRPFGGDDGERYEPGGLLGRGGMGEVRIAHDADLGRSIAVKTPRADVPGATDRLVREARLTAGLEHPNIVPVYGSGRASDGQPFYTMRLLPGRSLATTIRETPAPERPALVRHVLDAARAVAFAHQHVVLHRDLTPANLMVGPLGETLVADWGLATTVEEARTAPAAGTPGFASPEQLAGRATDARSDVYGLGAILYAVLTGEAPPCAPAPPVRTLAPTAPPELAAIADRALQADPAARYPDAAALAADVLAWFEGRRVVAHSYSMWELFTRFVSAWRAPLVVAGLAAVALVASIGIGWARTIVERDKARDAQADAVAARETAQHNLARALVSQARTAASEDRRAEAEILAANALVLAESPAARGVLAELGGRPRMRLASSRPLPGCDATAVSPDGARILCARGGVVRILDTTRPERVIAETPGTLDEGALSAGSVVWSGEDDTLWAWTPPAAPILLSLRPVRVRRLHPGDGDGLAAVVTSSGVGRADARTGQFTHAPPCGTDAEPEAAFPRAGGDVLVACSDRRVLVLPPEGEPVLLARLPAEVGVPSSLAISPTALVVGTVDGRVVQLDPTSGALRSILAPGTHAATQIALAGGALAVALADGSVTVWSGGEATPVGHLAAPGARIAWADDGHHLVVVGVAAEEWEVPERVPPYRIPFGAGVSAAVFSPDATLLAVALGDGGVEVRRRADGSMVTRQRWQDQVVKDVAFSADGSLLAAVAAGGDVQPLFDTSTWATVGAHRTRKGRRLAWLGDWLIGADYREQLDTWTKGTLGTIADAPAQLIDLEASGDGTRAAGLDTTRGVWALRAGAPPTAWRVGAQAKALAVAPVGDDILVATADGLVRLDPAGAALTRTPLDGVPIDLALSPDERWVAVGHVDGLVTVWRTGASAPTAILEGHGSRVSSVAWSTDGQWLATGSWDGSVRVWWTAELDRPAGELQRELEATWGRGLDAALNGRP